MSKKYWDKKSLTVESKESWQEPFSRDTSVPPEAIQANSTLLGFSGSWASAYSDGSISTAKLSSNTGEDRSSSSEIPNEQRWRMSKIGRAGMPEVNFVPYNYRTNALGNKGGSLIGHPISFSIVGSTMKDQTIAEDIEWQVDLTNNTLTLISLSNSITLNDMVPALDLYAAEGLYIVISEPAAIDDGGSPVTLDDLLDTGHVGLAPKQAFSDEAKYEIFRVISVNLGNNLIELDAEKKLSDYFHTADPSACHVKGITFFQPYVTRLVAVPESGDKGAEKTFVVVSPEHAAFDDMYPLPTTMDSSTRKPIALGKGQTLPIPIPVKSGMTGHLESHSDTGQASPFDGAGVFRLYGGNWVQADMTGGDLIHITDVTLIDITEEELKTSAYPFSIKNLIGWFEVIEASGGFVQLRRHMEVDVETGERFLGPMWVDNSVVATKEVRVTFTIHKPVSNLWSGDYDPDQVDACRLQNLIDPAWVERTTKIHLGEGNRGGSAARADKAIFSTSFYGTASNPGSLLDLGFRMVLFPAKDVGGNAVPDFNKPIDSLELTIDSSINEKQTIDIDYSAGIIKLSHAPKAGAGGGSTSDILPHGPASNIGANNNPRGEVVLFAACVPYSMERGQRGIGVSVTGGELENADLGYEILSYKSALGEQHTLQIITVSNPTTVQILSPVALPKTGFVSLVQRHIGYPKPTPDASRTWDARAGDMGQVEVGKFGYKKATFVSKDEKGYTYTLEGLYANDVLSNPTPDTTNHTFILRKEERVPLNQDTHYGSAWRSDSVRFAYADITANTDGSVTIMPTAVAGPAQELRGSFPLGSSFDIARLSFNEGTLNTGYAPSQNWTVSAPTHKGAEQYQIGLEVLRGKTFLTDSYDFKEVVTKRYLRAITKITTETLSAENSRTPAQNFTFTADIDANDKFPLKSLIEMNKSLYAMVEGVTYASRGLDWPNVNWNEGRVVIAIRSFDGTDYKMEAVNNPINWLAVQPTQGGSLADLVTTLNTGGTALNFTNFAKEWASNVEPSGTGRLLLSERDIEVMPSHHFLKSPVIDGGSPFETSPSGASMIITLYSANPHFANHWVTIPIQTQGNLSITDPREVAQELNRCLYDRNFPYYVGDQLSKAGFFKDGSVSSPPNPFIKNDAPYPLSGSALASEDQLERCIVFMAYDDPRHPAYGDPNHIDVDKVLLSCTGLGKGGCSETSDVVNGISEFLTSTGTENALFNVMCEVSPHGKTSATASIAHQWGWLKSQNATRFGLFYLSATTGTSLDQTSDHARVSIAHMTSAARSHATGNEHLFGQRDGLYSLGSLLGAHQIQSFNPISSTEESLSILRDNRTSYSVSSKSRSPSSEMSVGLTANLSRWVRHERFVDAGANFYERFDTSDAALSGFYSAWISITNRRLEEYEFSSGLTTASVKGTNAPVVISLESWNWISPDFDLIPIIGDRVNIYTTAGGSQWGAEGLLLYSNSTDKTALVLAQEKDFRSASEGLPTSVASGLFDPLANLGSTSTNLSITPRTTGLTTSRKKTLAIINKFAINVEETTGLTSGSSSLSSLAYIEGGHIDLFGTQGANNPAGISFGSVFTQNGENYLHMTHMDHGVFTTTYTERSLDSESFWNSFNVAAGNVFEGTKGGGGSIYVGSNVGGIAGVRFSGDTQIWLKGITQLGGYGSANFVKEAPISGGFDLFGIGYSNHSMARTPENAGGFLNSKVLGNHAPFQVSVAQNASGFSHVEATLVLGLTQTNYDSLIKMAKGVQVHIPTQTDLSLYYDTRKNFYRSPQTAEMYLVRALEGKYITLSDNTGGFMSTKNLGSWKIVDAPMVAAFGAKEKNYAYDAEKTGTQETRLTGQTDKSFVSTLVIRVERYNDSESNIPIEANTTGDRGYDWTICSDADGQWPIFISEVVESGGSPTGIPATLNGMTIDPLEQGKSYLPFQILDLGAAPTVFPITGQTKLYGVFPTFDSKGSPKTIAFFSKGLNDVTSLETTDVYARAIIRSWENNEFIGDLAEYGSQNKFSVDSSGRVEFGMTRRLSQGVLIDGGLGVVHATGFRSNPRPIQKETLGALSLFGSAGYPFANLAPRKTPISLSSVLDTTEFVDDVYMASPTGKLIFEDARAAQGLVARLKENIISLYSNRTHADTVMTNDALLPYNTGGLVFRGTGTVKYERAFSVLNARNPNSTLRGFLGKPDESGLKGLGVPSYGECYLLPAGPPTLAGHGMANYSHTGQEGKTPTDIPLYEWIGVASYTTKPLGLGINSIWSKNYNQGNWHRPSEETTAPEGHKLNCGSLFLAYKDNPSKTGNSYPNPSTEQVNLLDGMIIEDITNGTFYSVGDIGHQWIQTGKREWLAGEPQRMVAGVGSSGRPVTQGTRAIVTPSASAEGSCVLFDLRSSVGFDTNPFHDPCWGVSDRADWHIDADPTDSAVSWAYDSAVYGTKRMHIRRHTIGHQFRVTPNVEFVPKLGRYDVDGGLLPPLSKTDSTGNPTSTPQIDGTMITDADAVFYTDRYNFKKAGGKYGAGDVGKFIYICGTYTYQYTGWWLVMDVIKDYQVQQNWTGTENIEVIRDVAVLRKWKRDMDRVGDPNLQHDSLPLQKRSPQLNGMANSRIFAAESDFTDYAYTSAEWYAEDSTSDLNLIITDSNGDVVYNTVVLKSTIDGLGLVDIDQVQVWAGLNTQLNGEDAWAELNNLYGNIFPTTAPTNTKQFIKWEVLGTMPPPTEAKDHTLMISYHLAKLNEKQKEILLGHEAKLLLLFQTSFNMSGDPSAMVYIQIDREPSDAWNLNKTGFYSYPGINAAIDRGAGDRNNFAWMGVHASAGSGGGNGTAIKHACQSAAKGLRWVFSHPLTEEQVGAYMHLTKPSKYRWNTDVGSLIAPTVDGAAGAPFWTAREQSLLPENTDYETDIFRVNRCPVTKSMIIGGDCELYHRAIKMERKDSTPLNTPILYSPLSVNAPIMSDTGIPVSDVDYYNTAGGVYSSYSVVTQYLPVRYALQPIAREKIVAINPNSGRSNTIFDGSPVFPIQEIAAVNSPSNVLNVHWVYLSNPNQAGDHYFPPMESLSVGTPIIFRDTKSAVVNGQVGYIIQCEGIAPFDQSIVNNLRGSLKLTVYTPTFHAYNLTDGGYIAVSEGVRPYQVSGVDASQPWRLLGKGDTYIKGHRMSYGGAVNFSRWEEGGNNFGADNNNNYQWYPASRWWQIQNPVTYYGYNALSNEAIIEVSNLSSIASRTLQIGNIAANPEEYEFVASLSNPPVAKEILIGATTSKTAQQIVKSINKWSSHYTARIDISNQDRVVILARYGGNSSHNDIDGTTITNSNINIITSPTFKNGGEYKQIDMNGYDNAPPTLKIDLTEAFTQAMQSGAGVGSPYPHKYPKGVRLNRIWVNFGLWGNPMTDENDNATTLKLPGRVGDSTNDHATRQQAMTFNLILDLPSAAGNRPTEENTGAGTLPWNGKAPTSSFTKSDDNPSWILEESNLKSGSIIIPLYVNREAGDLSSNIQDRFSSVGPVDDSSLPTDWVDGHGKFGFGIGSYDVASENDFNESGAFTTGVDYIGNASNAVLFGGQDNFAFCDHQGANGNAKNGFVQASVFPRSSVLGGGLANSLLTSQAIMMDNFASDGGQIPRALYPAAVTGITVAHSAVWPLPPSVRAGSRQTGQRLDSASHAFTMALTPIGDSYSVPEAYDPNNNNYIDPVNSEVGKYGRRLITHTPTDPTGADSDNEPRNFKVGNWLDAILDKYGIQVPSGSMLPTGAKVYLEITVPNTRRKYMVSSVTGKDEEVRTSNGCWVGQVLCSFEVETSDGTALTKNVNILGED